MGVESPQPQSVRDLADGADLLRRLERLEALIPTLAGEALWLDVVPGERDRLERRITESTQSQSPATSPQTRIEALQDIVVAPPASAPTTVPQPRAHDDFGPPAIEFPESIYSDFVLTCARGRPWKICTSSLVLVICLIVQSAFTAMVAVVSVDGVTEMTAHVTQKGNTVNLYKAWVGTLDASEEFMGTTFTEQGLICNGLDWSWESEMTGQMADYANYSWLSAKTMPDGRFFGYAAITLWIGYCFQELYSIASFLCLLFMPPPADGGHAYVYDPSTGSGQLRGLTVGARAAILMVSSARLALTLFLGFFGIRFLAYTTGLADFILNSVALLFIQDVDDLCFAVLLSPDKQKAVKTLEAPLMQGLASLSVAKVRPCSEFLSVFLIFVVVAFFSSYIEDFSEVFMRGAYDQVCSNVTRGI